MSGLDKSNDNKRVKLVLRVMGIGTFFVASSFVPFVFHSQVQSYFSSSFTPFTSRRLFALNMSFSEHKNSAQTKRPYSNIGRTFQSFVAFCS